MPSAKYRDRYRGRYRNRARYEAANKSRRWSFARFERWWLLRVFGREVTSYTDRYEGRCWVAVCSGCDVVRDGFAHRIDACRWLLSHRELVARRRAEGRPGAVCSVSVVEDVPVDWAGADLLEADVEFGESVPAFDSSDVELDDVVFVDSDEGVASSPLTIAAPTGPARRRGGGPDGRRSARRS